MSRIPRPTALALLLGWIAVLLPPEARGQAVIGNELQDEMDTHPTVLHEIIVYFSERRVFTPTEIQTAGATRDERQSYVATEIVEFAQAQQEDALDILFTAVENKDADNIESLEVAYALIADAKVTVIEDLANLTSVRYITLRQLGDINAEADTLASGTTTPWGLEVLRASRLWDVGITGFEVLVAVFDGGFSHSHDDLSGPSGSRLWDGSALSYQGHSLTNNGWDGVDGDPDPDYGQSGHGTASAGIVGGDGTAGTQTGVAPGVTFMDVKVLGGEDQPIGWEPALFRGFDFLLDMKAEYEGEFQLPAVITMSGGNNDEPNIAAWRVVTDNLYWLDILMINATGNSSASPAAVLAPAGGPPPWLHPDQAAPYSPTPPPPLHVSGVLAVGAVVDEVGYPVWEDSGRGPYPWETAPTDSPPVPESYRDFPSPNGLVRPDLVAPTNVLSTGTGGGYLTATGTSAATPHVAGVAALLLQFNSSLAPAQIAEALSMAAIDVTADGHSPPQAGIGYDNASGAGIPDAYAALQYVAEHFGGTFPATFTIPEEETWNPEDVTLRFAPGASLIVHGTLVADGVTFTEAETGEGWDGIVVADGSTTLNESTVEYADIGVQVYHPGWLHTDDATLQFNRVGIDVLSQMDSGDENVFEGSVFLANGTAIRSDYLTCLGGSCPCLTGCRSTFTVENSCVVGSDAELDTGAGIWASNADARILGTLITENDGHGVYVEGGELRTGDVRISVNGGVTSPSGDGAHAAAYADLVFYDVFDSATGGNAVHQNAMDEVHGDNSSYSVLGAAFLPSSPPPFNAVWKTSTPGSGEHYVDNDDGSYTLPAQNVYWGSSSAPSSSFFEGLVARTSHRTTDPSGGAGRTGCPLPSSLGATAPDAATAMARGIGSDAVEGGAGRGDGFDGGEGLADLANAIREMRGALQRGPDGAEAARLLGELYALQRLDRADVLGERTATMGLLATLRARLTDPDLAPAAREVAEAALSAEIAEALLAEDYAGVADLVTGIGREVEGEGVRRHLRLAEVTLDAQAGRYDAAIARIDTLVAALPGASVAERWGLLARAALLAERRAARGASSAGVAAGPALSQVRSDNYPRVLALLPAYPNPATGFVSIPLDLPDPATVRIEAFDLLGRRVAALADGTMDPGRHLVRLDGSGLAAGTYVLRAVVTAGGTTRVLTQRLTLAR